MLDLFFSYQSLPKLIIYFYGILSGICGSLAFGYSSDKSWLAANSTIFLMVVAFIFCCQLAFSILRNASIKNFAVSIIITSSIGFLYGFSVKFIGSTLYPMQIMQPQPINILHIIGIITLTAFWIIILILRNYENNNNPRLLKSYVIALNSSQPHISTITAHRNYYQF